MCNESFIEKRSVKRDKRIYTRKHPYACIVCGESFNEQSNVKRHERIHNGGIFIIVVM